MRNKYTLLLLAILVFGLFLRFWNFPNWFNFNFDQETQAWVVKSLVVDHKPNLIGLETSVGGMFIGPYFNYLLVPFYLVGGMDPAATILLDILAAGATILASYYVGTKMFGQKAGLF